MERARFLWVRTCCGAGAAASEFSRHGNVRQIDPQHLWAAVALATTADVLCFDGEHPDIDCLKLVADTKARFPSLPIIMLISQQSADMMLWALRTRIFDVLVKPLTTREVLRCIQRLEAVMEARRTQSSRANATGAEVIPNEARYRVRPTARGKLESVIDFIAKNYARPITELEVAKTCGMSPFGFSRAFHAAHGVTFRDYLCEHRLAQSKRLLGNSQVSVTDVAAMAGFNDPSYFARLFRKRTGISPTEYRATLIPPVPGSLPLGTDDDNEASG